MILALRIPVAVPSPSRQLSGSHIVQRTGRTLTQARFNTTQRPIFRYNISISHTSSSFNATSYNETPGWYKGGTDGRMDGVR